MVFPKVKHSQCAKFLTAQNGRLVSNDNLKHSYSINSGTGDMEWDRKHSNSQLKDIPLLNIYMLFFFTQIQKFKQGDEVLVKSDENLVKELQKEHGGWNESMISVSLNFVSTTQQITQYCTPNKFIQGSLPRTNPRHIQPGECIHTYIRN